MRLDVKINVESPTIQRGVSNYYTQRDRRFALHVSTRASMGNNNMCGTYATRRGWSLVAGLISDRGYGHDGSGPVVVVCTVPLPPAAVHPMVTKTERHEERRGVVRRCVMFPVQFLMERRRRLLPACVHHRHRHRRHHRCFATAASRLARRPSPVFPQLSRCSLVRCRVAPSVVSRSC